MKLRITKHKDKWRVHTLHGWVQTETFAEAAEVATDLLEHRAKHKGGKL